MPAATPSRREVEPCLQVSPAGLLALDRLEQRLEVALAEAHRAVPLDQLEEDRRAVLDRLGEDLQEVAVLVAVGENLQLTQLIERDACLADPGAEVVVVAVRGVEELDPGLAHLLHGADD